MAFARILLIFILILDATTKAQDGSGESSGDSSGDTTTVETVEGSGETSTDSIIGSSSGEGSGETTSESFSGEGFIVTTESTVSETTEGSADGSGETTLAMATDGSADGSDTTAPTTDASDGSGSGSGETTIATEDGSELTTEQTTDSSDISSGSGSGETTTTADVGSGDTTTNGDGSGSGDTTDMTTDFGTEDTTTEPTMSCDQGTVNTKPLEITGTSIPSVVTESQTFQIQFSLKDSTSGQILDSLRWSECSWTATVTSLDSVSYKSYRSGFLSVTRNVNIDLDLAKVTVSGLSLSTAGMAVLQISMTTNPSTYQLTEQHTITVNSQNQITVTATKIIRITFNVNFDTYGTPEFKATVYNYVLSKSVSIVIVSIELERGSVIAKITVGAGSDSSISSLVKDVCTDFTADTSLSYNGQSVSISTIAITGNSGDESCHVETTEDSNTMLVVGMVSGIIFAVICIVIIIAILFWRFKVYPKRKIGSKEELKDEFEEEFIEHYDEAVIEKQAEVFVKYLGTSHFVEEKLWRSSFSSLREKSILADNPLAPISTMIPRNEKGHHSSYGPKFSGKSRANRKVAPIEVTEPLPPLMINGRRVNIPTKFSPFNFSFKK